MGKRMKTAMKIATGILMATVLCLQTQQVAMADAVTDAQQAQLLLLMQTPEYQAALAAQQAQQAQLAQIAAQQAAVLAAQQAAFLQAQQAQMAYLAALQAAQQAAWNGQLQAAQEVLSNAQYLQMSAVNQTYLLNAIQAQQKAQYESLLNQTGKDYRNMLLENYKKGQYEGIRSFTGYNGL